MNEKDRHEFVKKEAEAIYEEFEAHLEQLILLKPLFKNMVDVANGADSNYESYETRKKPRLV